MFQPRLFLLLLFGVAGIVVVFEMGFQNRLPVSGFTQSIKPLNGQDTVSTIALNNSRKTQGFSTRLPATLLRHDHQPQVALSTDGSSNQLVRKKLHARNHISELQLSSSLSRKGYPLSPVLNRAKSGKKIKNIKKIQDPSEAIIDPLMHVHARHGVNISSQLLKKLLRPVLGMPIVKQKSALRVLVVTYFRAGSTFLGDILQQNWKTFYHFEPLHMMSLALRINESQSQEALEHLTHLFKCELDNAASYIKWASNPKHQFLFRRNHFLWATCRLKVASCFTPEYISAVCRRALFQVMKVTRVHMRHVEQFLANNPDLNVKVVHLVRDPRGIVSSRKVLEWCNLTSCMDPKELCHEVQHDLEIFDKLKKQNPERFVQVRYEDLALNSSEEAKALYKALGMPFTSVVQRFIKTHTHARADEKNNPYSTRRNSSVTAFEWRHKLSFDDIAAIQKDCSDVMGTLGYTKFSSRKEQLGVGIPITRRIYEQHTAPNIMHRFQNFVVH